MHDGRSPLTRSPFENRVRASQRAAPASLEETAAPDSSHLWQLLPAPRSQGARDSEPQPSISTSSTSASARRPFARVRVWLRKRFAGFQELDRFLRKRRLGRKAPCTDRNPTEDFRSAGPTSSSRVRRAVELVRRVLAALASFLRDQILAPLVEGLLPAPCPGCRDPLPGFSRGGLCDRCWRSIVRVPHPVCTRCGIPFPLALDRASPALDGPCGACAIRPPAYDGARCALVYEDAVRTLLHLFKFDHRPDLARHLAPVIVGALPPDAVFDLVVPVPLHWTRRLKRGYNQAALLSRRVARKTGTPCREALMKRRRTRDQAMLDADERRRNPRGAFAVRTPFISKLKGLIRGRWLPLSQRGRPDAVDIPLPAAAGTRPARARRAKNGSGVAGARVLLIDDILTTGATAEECARVLKAAGAASVFVAAVARTPLRGPSIHAANAS